MAIEAKRTGSIEKKPWELTKENSAQAVPATSAQIAMGNMGQLPKVEFNPWYPWFSDIPETQTRYLLKGWLTAGQSVGFLYGASGSGKTTIAMNWAVWLSLGFTEWRGIKMRGKNRKVFYFCSEGLQFIKKRIKAILQDLQLPQETLDGYLYIFKKPEAVRAVEREIIDTTCFTEKTLEVYRDSIIKNVGENAEVDLIIVDTFNGFYGEDENSNGQIGNYISMLNNYLAAPFNANVMSIHHVNADSLNRRADEIQPRGGSALYSDADYAIAVACEKDHNPTDGIELYNRKQKEIIDSFFTYVQAKQLTLAPEYWKPDEDGEPATALVIDHSISEEQAKENVQSQWKSKHAKTGADRNATTAFDYKMKLIGYIDNKLIEFQKLEGEEEAYKIDHEQMAKAIEMAKACGRNTDTNFSQYMRGIDEKGKRASYFCGALNKYGYLEVKELEKQGNRQIYEYVFYPKRTQLIT